MKMKPFAVHANAPHPDSDNVGPDLANIRYTWIPHVPDGDLDQHYVTVSIANITNKKCIGSSTEL